jgi:hypothetical protein
MHFIYLKLCNPQHSRSGTEEKQGICPSLPGVQVPTQQSEGLVNPVGL